MRTRRFNMPPTQVKVGICTGGIKENKPQLELNMGELIRGTNYQEVDGVYHGYRSLAGYEVFDGTALASSVAAPLVEDKGNDRFAQLLLEPEISTISDLSRESTTLTLTNIIPTPYTTYTYFDYTWYFSAGSAIVFAGKEFLDKDFCIEATLHVVDNTIDQDIYHEPGVLRFFISGTTGKLNVILNEGDITEDSEEFDTAVTEGEYIYVSLRRISDQVIANINGTDETTVLVLSAPGYSLLATSGNANIMLEEAYLSQYRLSIDTFRRLAGDYSLIDYPFNSPYFYFLDYDDAARETRRSEIEDVPGAGPILGVTVHNGDVYAARDAVDGLSGVLYVSDSVNGWTEVEPFGEDGLAPDGTYQFLSGRFDLMAGLQRQNVLFFVNGVDEPKYLDGTGKWNSFTTTYLPDGEGTPTYATKILEFKNRLWLGYPDGRLVFSNIGDPLDFDPTTFSGVIYLESEILDMKVGIGDTLIVVCKDNIQLVKALASGDVTNQILVDYLFSNEDFAKIGGIENTAARLFDDIFYVDQSGLTSMSATQSFGDFETKSYSKSVQKTLQANLSKIVCAMTNKEYNQYRLFFNTGYGLIFTFSIRDTAKVVKGITVFKYDFVPTCCASGKDLSDKMMYVVGSSDGYVYKIDSGTSFNGDVIDTYLVSAYHHYNSPSILKHFRSITVEGSIPFDIDFNIKADFDYRDIKYSPSTVLEDLYLKDGAGSEYGTGVFGTIRYGSSENQAPVFYVNGYGTNMNVSLTSSNKYVDPHTLSSLTTQYTLNGRKM